MVRAAALKQEAPRANAQVGRRVGGTDRSKFDGVAPPVIVQVGARQIAVLGRHDPPLYRFDSWTCRAGDSDLEGFSGQSSLSPPCVVQRRHRRRRLSAVVVEGHRCPRHHRQEGAKQSRGLSRDEHIERGEIAGAPIASGDFLQR